MVGSSGSSGATAAAARHADPPPTLTATDDSLTEVKLRALARASAGVDLDIIDTRVGAARADTRAFYLVRDDPRALGRALHWAAAGGADQLDLLVERGAADLARRVGLLDLPGPTPSSGRRWPTARVWRVSGAEVAPAEAAPPVRPPGIPADHLALAGVMTEAGARAVDDHGVLVAEVAGLEVGRVVSGPDGPTIEVGVGQADRELNRLVHGETDPGAALRRVIAAVAEHRSATSHHPLARVARERWIRSLLLADPGLVGAVVLDPLPPLRPRTSMSVPEPAAAAGRLGDGRPVVVVAMVGADLDLVPEAADHRRRHDPDAAVVLVVPRRDVGPGSSLASALPATTVVGIDPPWAVA